MFIDIPASPNGLVFVCDIRLLNDRNLDGRESGTPVLRHWPFGKACLGRNEWARTTRIALFNYGEAVSAAVKHARQQKLLTWLHAHKPACTLVMQTRATELKSKDEFGEAEGVTGTNAWTCLGAPDRIPEMAGCVWAAPWGPTVGILNSVNYEYVYRELIRRHMRAAIGVASGHLKPLAPAHIHWHGELPALCAMREMARTRAPIAVDIESITESDIITAIGFGSGSHALSAPMEAFSVYRAGRTEPAATQLQLHYIRDILASDAPKLFHNYSFDVPFLERKGFRVSGPIHDTMAMHVCVYKQWPHGLQKACAHELLIPPWKSEHKPQGARAMKLTKRDIGWWTCEPEELRRYNALDSYYTFHLGRTLAPKVGITL